MRVLSVIHGPVYGGAHTQLLRLREPLERRGWETLAAVPTEPGNGLPRLREAGADVTALPLHRLRATVRPGPHLRLAATFAAEVRALRRLIREREVDVVQAHGPTNPHGALAAHLEGVGLVWQVYDTVAPMPLRRLCMPFVRRAADAMTFWGEDLARTHPGSERLGDRTIIVFPPVDTAPFERTPARRAEGRRRLAAPEGSVVVGTVGVRNPSKGHQYLVRAAEQIREHQPQAVFRVVGGPSPVHAAHEAAVRREAAERGLEDPGVLAFVDPGGDVPRIVPGFDIFVMTSVPRSEGMPTAILEAMACGLPVVSTDVGAVRELIDDGVTGFVVPPEDPRAVADSVLRLLRDPQLAAEMGGAGRRRARERFDLETLADLHARAYEAALEHRRARRRA